MSEIKDNGGPAFPCVHNKEFYVPTGMTLRDYFAAKAMQGMCAHPTLGASIESTQKAATYAYQFADAMLVERSRK